jgi:DNA-binding protein HU-beta
VPGRRDGFGGTIAHRRRGRSARILEERSVNKSDLVARMTERLGGDRMTAAAAVNGILEEIENSVARGEKVSLIGFGTFERRERAPRTGRNPQTGAAIQVDASVAPVFRAGAGFKSLLAQAANGTAAHISTPTTTSTPKNSAPKDTAKKDTGKKSARKDAAKKSSAKKSAAMSGVAATKAAVATDAGKGGKKAGKKATKKVR